MYKKIIPPGPGQESVWDYPRPPRVEPVSKPIEVIFNDVTVAQTHRAFRVLETSHPPTYYLPLDDVRADLLVAGGRRSFCEWKGAARYFDVVVDARRAAEASWSYPSPAEGFEDIAGHLAFYAPLMDRCLVAEEVVRPQPGGFYGGWITSDIVGPFKGEPGTAFW